MDRTNRNERITSKRSPQFSVGISEIFCQMVSILFLLGITVVPREIEDNSYVFLKKKRGIGGVGGRGRGGVNEVIMGNVKMVNWTKNVWSQQYQYGGTSRRIRCQAIQV